MKPRLKQQLRTILGITAAAAVFAAIGYLMTTDIRFGAQPHDMSLPALEPHARGFDCVKQADKAPPLDPAAQALYLQARKLESAQPVAQDRDYEQIVRLARQAAKRGHWQAMLYLADLYLDDRIPRRTDAKDAGALYMVENAIRAGAPAAYERMGTYYATGIGVDRDLHRALEFWQQAARMGNPQAMQRVAQHFIAIADNLIPGYWGNPALARQMLECSLAQGYGPAAEDLYFVSLYPELPRKPGRGDARLQALAILHEGVRHGCTVCAHDLSIEFDHPFVPSASPAPGRDAERSRRYDMLAQALKSDPSLRFPHLDHLLPLPPAPLPAWSGAQAAFVAAIGPSRQTGSKP